LAIDQNRVFIAKQCIAVINKMARKIHLYWLQKANRWNGYYDGKFRAFCKNPKLLAKPKSWSGCITIDFPYMAQVSTACFKFMGLSVLS